MRRGQGDLVVVSKSVVGQNRTSGISDQRESFQLHCLTSQRIPFDLHLRTGAPRFGGLENGGLERTLNAPFGRAAVRGRPAGTPAKPPRLRAQKRRGRMCGRGQLAEGEGFEPPVRLPAQRFSRPPRSTTPASLRRVETVVIRSGVSKGLNAGRQGWSPNSRADNHPLSGAIAGDTNARASCYERGMGSVRERTLVHARVPVVGASPRRAWTGWERADAVPNSPPIP